MTSERYARQVIIPEIGVEGQRRLRDARVFVVGAGGLGSPILLYLAAAGVGTLAIADNDQVSESNLNRQVLYTPKHLGRNKALVAVQRLRELNPEIKAIPHEERVLPQNGRELVAQYDLVVEASDNLETKALMNALCVQTGVPLVWAAVSRFEGQMGVYVPGAACRACVFPTTPAPGTYPTPAELGILGPVAGTIGALQATEALKLLLRIGEPMTNRLLLWDGLAGTFDTVQIERAKDCPVCAETDG